MARLFCMHIKEYHDSSTFTGITSLASKTDSKLTGIVTPISITLLKKNSTFCRDLITLRANLKVILGSNILSCQPSCISLITNHSRKPPTSRSSNTMTPQARLWYQFQLARIFSIFARFHSFPKRYEVCEPINLRIPLHLKFSESGCWSREKMP